MRNLGNVDVPNNEVGLQSTAKETFEARRADVRLMGMFGEPHPLFRDRLNCEKDHIEKIKTYQSHLIDYKLLSQQQFYAS